MFKNRFHEPFGVNLYVLKLLWLYIPQDTEEERKKYKLRMTISYSIKFWAYITSWGTTFIHLVMVKREKLDVDTNEDLTILVSTAGIIIVCFGYPLYSKSWSKILLSLTDYSTFGKPPKTDETIKFCNWIAIVVIILYFNCVSIFEFASLYEAKSCMELAERKGVRMTCLTMSPVWLPFEIDIPTQLIISFVQTMLMYVTTVPAGVGIHLPWEVSQHLYNHIQHLNSTFNNIFETDDEEEQRKRLNKWIKYHNHIISIISELDKVTKGCVGILSLVVSLVCALTVHQLTKGEKTFAALATLVGWFWSQTINCITGQQIINQTDSITTNVICSNWYMASLSVKKDIIFVLSRTQRPFTLNALPLGTLNMELLLMIVKSSYSYVTLLENTA